MSAVEVNELLTGVVVVGVDPFGDDEFDEIGGGIATVGMPPDGPLMIEMATLVPPGADCCAPPTVV